MLVYGRNVAKELLGKNRKIEKIIQEKGTLAEPYADGFPKRNFS